MEAIMDQIHFSPEEKAFFIDLYHRLSPGMKAQLDILKQRYFNPGDHDTVVNFQIRDALTQMANAVGSHPYSMHMLFLLLCAPELPKGYAERGWDVKYAYNLLMDLRYKLIECENCNGVMGTQCFDWLHYHFLFKRLNIGYFQYDPHNWDLDVDYDFGEIHLTKGVPIHKFHIPSAGKMPRQIRLASYCAFHDFLGYEKGEPVVLFCRSWLLYEPYRNVFPKGSNLLDFMDDFDLVWNGVTERFEDSWRIFNHIYDGDTTVLPCDTTLQRNFIEYIENGGTFGCGAGVIICDGERILNNKRDFL